MGLKLNFVFFAIGKTTFPNSHLFSAEADNLCCTGTPRTSMLLPYGRTAEKAKQKLVLLQHVSNMQGSRLAALKTLTEMKVRDFICALFAHRKV